MAGVAAVVALRLGLIAPVRVHQPALMSACYARDVAGHGVGVEE